jgi:ATP adenylyltransferase/5',5'''-P-1,P-4-tetraphosphate phosphorylase II
VEVIIYTKFSEIIDKMDYSDKARIFIHEQISEWDLANKNYSGLKKVKVKTFDFGDYYIDIQYNPERIISSSANVDPQSIESRTCFLCLENLSPQQRELMVNDDYRVLVNPFPIFPEHFTIPNVLHTDQRISGNFGIMLDLAARLNKFVIFYNGPQCGASAPDHLHFQAGTKGFLPIENDYLCEICCREVRRIDSVIVSHWPEYQRGIITLASKNRAHLIDCFEQIYQRLAGTLPDVPEPMLNILATFDSGEWVIHIIPRAQHRPSQYFESGEKQILLSPASVDLGGVMITPREEDFIKITEDDVLDIFQQVCFDTQSVLTLINKL